MDLGKKVGPLPVGAWIAVVLGGLGVGYFINRNNAESSESEPVEDPYSDTGRGGQQLIYTGDPVTSTQGPAEITDNVAWGRQALNYLISLNTDPLQADQTVRAYLEGQNLTPAQRALISLVLLRFGSPPEAIRPMDTAPGPQVPEDKPKPKPAPKSESTRIYRTSVSARTNSPVQSGGRITITGRAGYAHGPASLRENNTRSDTRMTIEVSRIDSPGRVRTISGNDGRFSFSLGAPSKSGTYRYMISAIHPNATSSTKVSKAVETVRVT